MVSKAPDFWWQKPGFKAWALSPLSALYGAISAKRMRRMERPSVSIPVICIGNYTVGGAGKTPTAIALARTAKDMGLKVGFLSRGYGGSLKVPTLVDPELHDSFKVGDEPLLLAREAMVVVSRKRIDGARLLEELGADLIIMDDGFQSAQLTIDFSLIVVDSTRSVGNGFVLPSGPLRVQLPLQIEQTDMILKVGKGREIAPLLRHISKLGKRFLLAEIRPRKAPALIGQKLIAFAGIGDPEKFYRTLRAEGLNVIETVSFPDHHVFTEIDANALLSSAKDKGALLVTTAKDAVRLKGRIGAAKQLSELVHILEIDMRFDDPSSVKGLIEAAREKCRTRLLAQKAQAN
jgi:tetraacyldisaccharide 4'-kinase